MCACVRACVCVCVFKVSTYDKHYLNYLSESKHKFFFLHQGEIYIKEPMLKSLPTDAIDFLRELTVFSIENSQIMTVPRVVGLRKLKLFKIDGSNIKDIPQRTLRDLPSLRYLHVSRSPITRLDIGVLENLKYLVLANFTDNQLNWVHPRAFRYMEVTKY